MQSMFPATRAKLAELKTIRIVATILLGGVIPLFAIIAFKRNDRSNVFLLGCHSYLTNFLLFDNSGNDACADGQAAFADGELRTLLQRHRHDQLHRQVHIVSGGNPPPPLPERGGGGGPGRQWAPTGG